MGVLFLLIMLKYFVVFFVFIFWSCKLSCFLVCVLMGSGWFIGNDKIIGLMGMFVFCFGEVLEVIVVLLNRFIIEDELVYFFWIKGIFKV